MCDVWVKTLVHDIGVKTRRLPGFQCVSYTTIWNNMNFKKNYTPSRITLPLKKTDSFTIPITQGNHSKKLGKLKIGQATNSTKTVQSTEMPVGRDANRELFTTNKSYQKLNVALYPTVVKIYILK